MGPTRLLVNRRPAEGPDKDEDIVGGAIWRGNHRKSGSGDMVEGAIAVASNQATS